MPTIGFFILPWTTLAYALMWSSGSHVTGLEWFIVSFAFLIDLGAYFGGQSQRSDNN